MEAKRALSVRRQERIVVCGHEMPVDAFGLSKNHPFLDGNKRIAAVICETLLDLDGREIQLSEAEKYVQYYALAAGEHTEESFAQWLRENSGPIRP